MTRPLFALSEYVHRALSIIASLGCNGHKYLLAELMNRLFMRFPRFENSVNFTNLDRYHDREMY
jgi:hypothetical protein